MTIEHVQPPIESVGAVDRIAALETRVALLERLLSAVPDEPEECRTHTCENYERRLGMTTRDRAEIDREIAQLRQQHAELLARYRSKLKRTDVRNTLCRLDEISDKLGRLYTERMTVEPSGIPRMGTQRHRQGDRPFSFGATISAQP